MAIKAFSSVVVTDYSDVGTINLYLTSNQPTTVIYDPNQNTYTPDWSKSNLVLTPVISFNGNSIDLSASNLSVSWEKQEGSGTAVNINDETGISTTENKLTVSANKLANVSSNILTYICNVTYTDVDTNVPLTARAVMTYSLISNASKAKSASISGESTFLYDTNRQIVGSNTIVLEALLNNVSIGQWQYKNADGDFVVFPTTNNASVTDTTLKVLDSESAIWLNGKTATIRLTTSDDAVYDVHSIVKIYDGAAGTDTISAVLSNENHLAPADADGNVKSFTGAETQIYIYEGGDDVTSDWTITATPSTGLTGTYNSSTHIFTPSTLTVDVGYVEFVCTKTGYANVVKRYTITKQYAGVDGEAAVIYEVSPDVYAINVDESGNFTPESILFSSHMKSGESFEKSSYAGRFIISESTDGKAYNAVYTSSQDETSVSFKPSSNSVVSIKCVLYKAGGATIQLDEQTVVVTRDGKTGSDGDDGANGVSVVVGNDSEVIACDTVGNALSSKDISIPFYGYDGITKTAITCTVGTLPTGVSVKSNTAGTTSSGGLLILSVAAGATFGSSSLMSGDITLTFVCKGQSVEKKFTWTKSIQAEDGQNAVLLQVFSPDGGTIYNGEGSTTLQALMTSGADTVTPTKYQWAKYQNGSGYVDIDDGTSASLTVTSDMVDATSWFRCQATYNGKTYTAYWTVYDKSDPVQSYTFATVGEFKNSQGCAAVYTRVYRNGVEIDPIKSTTFSTTAPTGASSGAFYYHLDETAKTCTLKKYDGTSWVNATEKDSLTYSYYRVDSNGNEMDTAGAYKTERCFYIDPTIVNGQMQFMCEVSGTLGTD